MSLFPNSAYLEKTYQSKSNSFTEPASIEALLCTLRQNHEWKETPALEEETSDQSVLGNAVRLQKKNGDNAMEATVSPTLKEQG